MLPQEEQKLAILFDQMVKALKRQGMSERTVDAYSRVVFRLGRFFDKCPDELEKNDLKKYFDHLIGTRSWSTVRADRCAMQFFWKHVLNRNWKWVNIVKPPQIRPIPDVLTVAETEKVLNAVRELRYRIFLFTLYSMGLRLKECLSLKVSDIDSERMQIHIRSGKGRKDRLVPLPAATLKALRFFWKTHRLEGKTRKWRRKTLPGAKFLWLVVQHTLPSGFRRARDFGFLHGNSRKLLTLIQLLLKAKPPMVD